jgi:MoaD family protein
MKIKVQYMSQLRTVVGSTEEELELAERCSLAELLTRLATTHCAAKSHFVTETGQPRPSLLIVVNDSAVSAREAATTMLHSNDVVTLLPPIAGG